MTVQKLKAQSGTEIAYHKLDPQNENLPGVLFCGGFMSDMEGSKATFLEQKCEERGQGFVRFDYGGHGASSGSCTEGTIGGWLADAESVLMQLTEGPQIIVGSSMGGWITLMLALKHPDRLAGVVGIAAAPDFTQEMYDEAFDEAQKKQLAEEGLIYLPSDYGEPYPITEHLIEDGESHLLLHKDDLRIDCPVRLLHGKADSVVPWEKSLRIKDLLTSTDVGVHFIDEGDHSLSCDAGLLLLDSAVKALTEIACPGEEIAESS